MNYKLIPYYIYIGVMMVLASCNSHPTLPERYSDTKDMPAIYPDYTNVTIPCNIAPLNFMVKDAEECVAQLKWGDNTQTYGKGKNVQIPQKEWEEMLQATKGGSIGVEVYTRNGNEWKRHKSFAINVAKEEIDPYISYRVICPSYIAYEMLSINQRCLSNFEEHVIYNNMMVSNEEVGQCINCHSYQNYGTDNMQFHMRQGFGGTMIVSDGTPRKVDLKTAETISAGVYPSWHPTLKLIAYSTNLTGQSFHTKLANKIEVFDSRSDLILYDVERNQVSTISAEENEMEVFPWWAPDGRTLYYASAHFVHNDSVAEDADIVTRYDEIKYNIYRRTFHVEDYTFSEPELVYDASAMGKSATLPRISPCGRYLLFTQGTYGCFHIWHPEADLYLMDLTTGNTRPLRRANSTKAESYHSWSSNGRWILFSSRRHDSNYTRLYIAYIDEQGKDHKAFAVPQEDPMFYQHYMRSYNVPEFMVEPVKITPQEFAAAAKKDAIKASYIKR